MILSGTTKANSKRGVFRSVQAQQSLGPVSKVQSVFGNRDIGQQQLPVCFGSLLGSPDSVLAACPSGSCTTSLCLGSLRIAGRDRE